MISALEQALASLTTAGESGDKVRRLADLVDGDLPLQGFLEQLLPLLCDLFAAPAAVAWMKAQGAVFGVRYRMDQLLPTGALQKKHERLVQLAWHQKRPLLAEPANQPDSSDRSTEGIDGDSVSQSQLRPEFSETSSGPATKSNRLNERREDFANPHFEAQNPTDHRLLFAPILHLAEPIALIEIVLTVPSGAMQSGVQSGTHPGSLTTAQKQLYLRTIQLVAERVYGGLKRRMSMPAAQLNHAVRELSSLVGQIQSFQSQIQRAIELKLAQFHGWSFDSLAENQEFARLVHQILDSHGLRVVCPECGYPAILRCLRAGNAKHGVFVFDHYLETGRTFHGGPTTFPELKVVAKPARRSANAPPSSS